MKRIVNAFGKLNWGKRACAVFVLCATTAMALSAQTFTNLLSFNSTDGATPNAPLIQATNGDLYGTTSRGGANFVCCGETGGGTVFKITPGGTLTTLYSFCSQINCTDGKEPYAALVQATNGDFYGTTFNGGATNCAPYGCGTVFKITPGGRLTTLYSFCSQINCTDGYDPQAALVQATNGDFYGTTVEGGATNPEVPDGGGTVFKITPGGTLTTLYNFCSQINCADGDVPVAGLVQDSNGNFYGTTYAGGAHGGGTVFKITPNGTLTTLYSFCSQSGCTDGSEPAAALVQGSDGNFCGTTGYGGANLYYGTVFKITPSGTLTTLHSFDGTDGYDPQGLVHATDGDFYGTTEYGGENGNYGTVFKITPSGALTTLHSFDGTDGYNPLAAPVQDTNGNLYGTTGLGGANSCIMGGENYGCGTAFSLSVSLGPFVETLPAIGKVGAAVKILGTDLTGATSVSFNGTAAVFKVVSSSEITTKVPAGANTGKVRVVTPSVTLSSNAPFRVP